MLFLQIWDIRHEAIFYYKIFSEASNRKEIQPNTAAGKIPEIVTLHIPCRRHGARDNDQENAPNVKQDRTQERYRNDCGKSNKNNSYLSSSGTGTAIQR